MSSQLVSIDGPEPIVASPKTLEMIGNWRVIAVETLLPNGDVSTAWLGEKPVGMLTYQPNGLVSVQIMRDPRPVFAANDLSRASAEEVRNAYAGYYAYWGTYTVNAKARSISHQITASLLPQEVGVTVVRHYEIEGDGLVLTTPIFKYEGMDLRNKLTWERVRGPVGNSIS